MSIQAITAYSSGSASKNSFSEISSADQKKFLQNKIREIDFLCASARYEQRIDRIFVKMAARPVAFFLSGFSGVLGVCVISPAFEASLFAVLASLGIIAMPSAAPLGVGVFLVALAVGFLAAAVFMPSPPSAFSELEQCINELKVDPEKLQLLNRVLDEQLADLSRYDPAQALRAKNFYLWIKKALLSSKLDMN